MSKRKRKKGKRATEQKRQAQPLQMIATDDKHFGQIVGKPIPLLRHFSFFTTSIAVAIMGLTFALTNWYSQVAEGIRVFLGVGAFTVMSLRTVIFRKEIADYRNLYKRWVLIANSILASSMITIASLPALFALGFIGRINIFVAWVIPQISQNIGTWFSVAITFIAQSIFSGILGNFAYDLLKKSLKGKDMLNEKSRK